MIFNQSKELPVYAEDFIMVNTEVCIVVATMQFMYTYLKKRNATSTVDIHGRLVLNHELANNDI